MVGSPIPFSASQTLPDVPPAPVSADWDPVSGLLQVVFDQVLRPGPLDFTNWTIRLDFETVTPFAAVFLGATAVLVAATTVLGPPQANECDFAPPPDDVRNLRLNPALPFAGFPVSVPP